MITVKELQSNLFQCQEDGEPITEICTFCGNCKIHCYCYEDIESDYCP